MDENKINHLIEYTKMCHPKDAVDISDGLDILNMALDGLRENINLTLSKLLKEKNYTEVREVTNASESVAEIQNLIDGYVIMLEVPLENDEKNEYEESATEEEKTIPNYGDYVVNDALSHNLYEDFTHKKVTAFSFEGNRYEAKDWKDVLVQTCDLLADIDSDKFYLLVNDPVMKGRKIAYFGYESVVTNNGIKNCQMKNLDVYVWTNLSANQIRNLIRKLLKKYGIRISDFYVYLRADYTALHIDRLSISEKEIHNDDKIGKYVRTAMRKISNSRYEFSLNELSAMQSKKWSKDELGLDYPMLKPYKEGVVTSEQIKEGSYRRYWKEIFEFNNKKFFVTSQWFDRNRENFENWFTNL
ncbi:MAG TPA: hypothetical protein DDX29_10070 [Clostridiales bacterium]|nr:hypothetical protein [Clostridiales bacterium]